jgi:hypothetical protein
MKAAWLISAISRQWRQTINHKRLGGTEGGGCGGIVDDISNDGWPINRLVSVKKKQSLQPVSV